MTVPKTPAATAHALALATISMAEDGAPLMRRVLPDGAMHLWDRYPMGDIVAGNGARAFYHAHPPGERAGMPEHGHFHFFLPRTAMPPEAMPLRGPLERGPGSDDVVHIIAMSFADSGLPTALFTVNRWVTDEWLYPAADIMGALHLFDLADSGFDPLACDWLTAAVHLCRPLIGELLEERDAVLARGVSGEDPAAEVLSHRPLDLQGLLAQAM